VCRSSSDSLKVVIRCEIKYRTYVEYTRDQDPTKFTFYSPCISGAVKLPGLLAILISESSFSVQEVGARS